MSSRVRPRRGAGSPASLDAALPDAATRSLAAHRELATEAKIGRTAHGCGRAERAGATLRVTDDMHAVLAHVLQHDGTLVRALEKLLDLADGALGRADLAGNSRRFHAAGEIDGIVPDVEHESLVAIWSNA